MSNVEAHPGVVAHDATPVGNLGAGAYSPALIMYRLVGGEDGLPSSLHSLSSKNELLRINIPRDFKSRHCRPATWCSSCVGYTRLSGRSFLASVRVSVTPAERNLAEGKIASLEEKMSVMAGVCL